MPDPAGVAQIKCQDLLAALAVFLIVVAATFTVVLPFAGRMMKMRANWQLASAPSPRPTVSRLCRTLVEMGYLDRDERIDR
jgi:predicted secreted protein